MMELTVTSAKWTDVLFQVRPIVLLFYRTIVSM